MGRDPKPNDRRVDRHKTRTRVVTMVPRSEAPPAPPEGLLASTKTIWDQVWASDIAKAMHGVDPDGLARYITYRDEWQRCMNAVRKSRLVKGSTGQPRLNPLAEHALKLESAMRGLATDLGLTPLARMKLGIAIGQAAKTIEELNRDADEDETEAEAPDPRLAALELTAQDN